MVAAVQRLQTYILAQALEVHVLNISFHGNSDPDSPPQLALDRLEREHDVLVVVLAGNQGDTSQSSHGLVNGVSVGNVHKFAGDVGRYPHRVTSRGPLFGDSDRYFPDVCASGSSGPTLFGTQLVSTNLSGLVTQILMPLVDHQSPATACNRSSLPALQQYVYNAAGSSMSAPQVAGAAALYRAERASASAQETKAALLLASIDPHLQASSYSATDTTYTGRNAYGVGYVRDSLLARYALRLDAAIGQQVILTPQNQTADVTWAGLTVGADYAVATAWPRPMPDDVATQAWANVDLEVLTPGGASLIARSDSLRNTYERLVFRANVDAVKIRVKGTDLVGQTVPVFVAARSIGGDGPVKSNRSIPGFVARLPQEAGCTLTGPDQRVTRVLPSWYRQAYGSAGLSNSLLPPLSTEANHALKIATTSTTTTWKTLFGPQVLDIPVSVPPGNIGYHIRGLALRTWRPMPGAGGSFTVESIYLKETLGLDPGPDLSVPVGATLVASNVTVSVQQPAWNARDWNTWSIIIPLDQPFAVHAGSSLVIWMRVQPQPIGVEVDGTSDGLSPPAVRQQYGCSPDTNPMNDGVVPVFGVIEDAQVTAPPDLYAYGLPSTGNTMLFQLRQAGASNPAWIVLGTANPGFLSGSCRIMSNLDLGTLGPITTAPMGHMAAAYTIPNNSAFLHQHVFVQGVVQTSSGLLYSNGVRMTIGGVWP